MWPMLRILPGAEVQLEFSLRGDGIPRPSLASGPMLPRSSGCRADPRLCSFSHALLMYFCLLVRWVVGMVGVRNLRAVGSMFYFTMVAGDQLRTGIKPKHIWRAVPSFFIRFCFEIGNPSGDFPPPLRSRQSLGDAWTAVAQADTEFARS